MDIVAQDGTRIHVLDEGDPAGAPWVFANSLGSDTRLWDDVLPLLPDGLRLIRWDLRGHGLSDVPDGPYKMGSLIADAEAVLDSLGITQCTFVGLSIGGLIAQGLAVKRPDLIARMVLSNTAAKIGTSAMWQDRINTLQTRGMAPLVDGILDRWFGRNFRNTDGAAEWRERLLAVSPVGYAGCCAAISGTDFYTPTSGLRLPTLAIAGGQDQSTPADLVRETAELIPGSTVRIIPSAGHLPPIETPETFARLLCDFQ